MIPDQFAAPGSGQRLQFDGAGSTMQATATGKRDVPAPCGCRKVIVHQSCAFLRNFRDPDASNPDRPGAHRTRVNVEVSGVELSREDSVFPRTTG